MQQDQANRSLSTKAIRRTLNRITNDWAQFRREKQSLSSLRQEISFGIKDHDRLKFLVNTVEQLSSSDPRTLNLVYGTILVVIILECMHKDTKKDEMKNIIEARSDYKNGVADPKVLQRTPYTLKIQ